MILSAENNNKILPAEQEIPKEKSLDLQNQELQEKQQHIALQVPNTNMNSDELDKSSQNGIRLDFKNVCLDVNLKNGEKKRILDNVSGYVNPGELLYIMGPSGSGKTTLLDFLCDRTFQNPEKNVFFNKQTYKKSEFHKIGRYCQQEPVLYEILTVQETLEYAASFFTKSKKERNERVNKVLKMLGLENQRDTKIGGLFFRGISGGQRKRVSVGEQLVANPKLLFLDEPTSGLDSASAFQLMEKLREIKQTGITIISSIHQPSQRVFNLSDRLLILAGGKGFGGTVAYFGQTRSMSTYFNNLGIKNLEDAGISEWALDKVNGDYGNDEEIKNILKFYKESQDYQQLQAEQKDLDQVDVAYKYRGKNTKQGHFKDMLVLFKRGIQNNFKNPLALFVRVALYCAMAIVVGSVWYGIADSPDAGDIQNISGVLFFMSTFYAFMTVSVLPVNVEDKQIMIKEKSNGCYGLVSYSITNLLVSLPVTFIVALTAGSIVYFMVGFQHQSDFSDYLIFILNLFIAIAAPEAMMLIVSNIFNLLLICIVVAAFLFGSFMIMNGFFIKIQDIPTGWKWLHYAAFNTYAFENFMVGGYEGKTIGKNVDIIPPAVQDFSGDLVLKDMDMDDVSVGTNMLIMVGFIFAFRLIAFVYSHFKHTGKK